MTYRSRATLVLRWAVVLAAALTTGCGGSSEEEDFPVLFDQYGGAGTAAVANMASFDQQYSWSDGESWTNICTGIIDVLNQEGAAH